ncbi:MAG: GNAT family N-acetyltransferase [Anaerolineae bacterium]|nr:GNAT family N-acetyltransferase [Anaerolineae bacterium]
MAAFRGQHLGELLLASMLQRGLERGAQWASLEVRVSNLPAIHLYEKYGYRIVRRKMAYYLDNNEDAHWMAIRPLGSAYAEFLAGRVVSLRQHVAWQDDFVERSLP